MLKRVYITFLALVVASCARQSKESGLRGQVRLQGHSVARQAPSSQLHEQKPPAALPDAPEVSQSTGQALFLPSSHAGLSPRETSVALAAGPAAFSLSRLHPYYRPQQAFLAQGKRPQQSASAPKTALANTSSPLLSVESRVIGQGPTFSGLDVLKREDFKRLKGKRVALLTNHSAIDKDGNHILDLMYRSPNVQLVTLFSPEHGLYGNVDTKTPDSVDTATGLLVHSLYSSRKDKTTKPNHPRQEDLRGLDVVVVDMQDIGARFYTYCSYMAFMMEECARLGIEVMVLDRPNPIGGLYVDGPLADEDLLGKVTIYFKMPVAHGMTMGELARMFNSENHINAKLTVIRAENWGRDMYFDQTGLRWVNPSPNIQDLDAALAYPGIAMTEAIVSMGRGTSEPFHLFGTPYIEDPQELCNAVNSAGLEGVRLEVADFTPTGTLSRGHIGEGKLCKGARIVITDRRRFRPVTLGILVMNYLQGKYGSRMVQKGEKCTPLYDVMALRGSANAALCAQIRERKPVEETLNYVREQVEQFKPIRAKYLMYPGSLFAKRSLKPAAPLTGPIVAFSRDFHGQTN